MADSTIDAVHSTPGKTRRSKRGETDSAGPTPTKQEAGSAGDQIELTLSKKRGGGAAAGVRKTPGSAEKQQQQQQKEDVPMGEIISSKLRRGTARRSLDGEEDGSTANTAPPSAEKPASDPNSLPQPTEANEEDNVNNSAGKGKRRRSRKSGEEDVVMGEANAELNNHQSEETGENNNNNSAEGNTTTNHLPASSPAKGRGGAAGGAAKAGGVNSRYTTPIKNQVPPLPSSSAAKKNAHDSDVPKSAKKALLNKADADSTLTATTDDNNNNINGNVDNNNNNSSSDVAALAELASAFSDLKKPQSIGTNSAQKRGVGGTPRGAADDQTIAGDEWPPSSSRATPRGDALSYTSSPSRRSPSITISPTSAKRKKTSHGGGDAATPTSRRSRKPLAPKTLQTVPIMIEPQVQSSASKRQKPPTVVEEIQPLNDSFDADNNDDDDESDADVAPQQQQKQQQPPASATKSSGNPSSASKKEGERENARSSSASKRHSESRAATNQSTTSADQHHHHRSTRSGGGAASGGSGREILGEVVAAALGKVEEEEKSRGRKRKSKPVLLGDEVVATVGGGGGAGASRSIFKDSPEVSELRSILHHSLTTSSQQWALAEWFVPEIDRGFLAHGAAEETESVLGIEKDAQLNEAEWSAVRKRLGRPKRFGSAFLEQERSRLHINRNNIRLARQGLAPPSDFVGPRPDVVSPGTQVVAIHPETKLPLPGVVEGMHSASSYWVKFEGGVHLPSSSRSSHGGRVLPVADIGVMSLGPPSFVPNSAPLVAVPIVPANVFERQNAAGGSSSAAASSTPSKASLRSAAAAAAAASVGNIERSASKSSDHGSVGHNNTGNSSTRRLNLVADVGEAVPAGTLLELVKAVKQKERIVEKLQKMNQRAASMRLQQQEPGAHLAAAAAAAANDVVQFQRDYAWDTVQLHVANQHLQHQLAAAGRPIAGAAAPPFEHFYPPVNMSPWPMQKQQGWVTGNLLDQCEEYASAIVHQVASSLTSMSLIQQQQQRQQQLLMPHHRTSAAARLFANDDDEDSDKSSDTHSESDVDLDMPDAENEEDGSHIAVHPSESAAPTVKSVPSDAKQDEKLDLTAIATEPNSGLASIPPPTLLTSPTVNSNLALVAPDSAGGELKSSPATALLALANTPVRLAPGAPGGAGAESSSQKPQAQQQQQQQQQHDQLSSEQKSKPQHSARKSLHPDVKQPLPGRGGFDFAPVAAGGGIGSNSAPLFSGSTATDKVILDMTKKCITLLLLLCAHEVRPDTRLESETAIDRTLAALRPRNSESVYREVAVTVAALKDASL